MAVRENVVRALAEEHARVRLTAGEAAKLAREGAGDEECAGAIRELETHITRHFRLEESGGYMAHVIDAAPHRTRDVKALGAEHGKMLEELAAIRKAIASGGAWRDRFEIWIRTLREHEEAENELVLGSLRNGDGGSG